MHYLDANAFVYPALYDGPKAAGARELLESVTDGEVGGATAALTVDEVVYVLGREADRETAIAQGRRILELPNLRVLDVDGSLLVRTLSAMEDHHVLTPRDAVHYAAMRAHGIHAIATDDRDFERIPDVDRHALESYGTVQD